MRPFPFVLMPLMVASMNAYGYLVVQPHLFFIEVKAGDDGRVLITDDVVMCLRPWVQA